MAKISELTTLTAPITSSDLAMMIRPNSGGGYSSYKSPLDNFGKIRVTGSIGLTGSMLITGSGENLIVSGSSIFGSGNSNGYYGANKSAAMQNFATNGYSRVEIGTGFAQPYKSGLHVWNSGSASEWASGSTYMWYNIGQSKNPYGGVQQYGYIVRSQYAGTTQGSASYLTATPTASQALWVCRPSFNDQLDNMANSQWGDAFDLVNPPGDVHALVFKLVTGSNSSFSVLTAGPETGEYSTGSFAGVGAAGRYGGFRMPYGTIFAPRAYGVQLGNLGIASYTTAVKMGFENGGGAGHIVLCSGSNMPGVYSTLSASLGLIATDGDLLLYTGAFNDGGVRIIGSTRATGSVAVGGFLHLGDGSVAGVGASDARSGSISYVSSSGELLVFTGDGATTHKGATGWKVVTLT